MLCNATINPLNGMLSYVEIDHLCWSRSLFFDKLPFSAHIYAHRKEAYQRGETSLLKLQVFRTNFSQ